MVPIAKFMNTIKKEFSWNRPLGTYGKVQSIYSTMIRGKKFQLKNIRSNGVPYLNIGSGPKARPGYINLDYRWRPNVQVCWDITRGLPFGSESMKGIFTEHCLEHVTYAQCIDVLKECHRILQPGGAIRIIVPDAELYIELYRKEKQGEKVLFPHAELLQAGFTPIMAINRIFREHNHKYAYDATTLRLMLKQAGFARIEKTGYMEGRDKKLLIDSPERKEESLYLEASKPLPYEQ